MQKKSKIKDEKGSMAVYVTVVLMTILVILTTLYSYTSLNRKSQLKTVLRVKEAYYTYNKPLIDYKIYGNSVQHVNNVQAENLIDISDYYIVNSVIGIDISKLVIGETYSFSSNTVFESVKISNKYSGYNSVYELNTKNFIFEMTKNESIPSTATQYLFLKLKGSWISDESVLGKYDIQIKAVQPKNTPVKIISVGDKTENLMPEFDLGTRSASYELTGNGFKATTTTLAGGYDNFINTPLINIKDIGWGATYTVTCKVDQSIEGMNPLMRVGYKRNTNGSWKDLKNLTINGDGTYSITFTLPTEKPEDFGVSGYSTEDVLLWFNIQRDVLEEYGSITVTDIMLNNGNTAKKYVPSGYKIPIVSDRMVTNIYLDEPLRKIDDYEDYIDFENQKVVRQIGEYRITGTENWTVFSETYPHNFHATNVIDTKYEENIKILSNQYIGQYSNKGSGYGNGNTWVQATDTYPRLYISDENYDSVDTFKQELAYKYDSGNPVIIYYPLKTQDDTETIELPVILTKEGTTTIEVNTTIPPSQIDIIN